METQLKFLKTKIHRATVTDADLHYEGSLTIPADLMEVSGIRDFEAVQIWNVTSGTRLETYAMTGEKPGIICANGAAAHLVKPGDLVIISSFIYIPELMVESHNPKIIFVDEKNQVVEQRAEIAGPTKR